MVTVSSSPAASAQRPSGSVHVVWVSSGEQRWVISRERRRVSIKVGDVDLDRYKIFIDQGKGAKDRYILFPASFRLVLKSHLRASPDNRYLFETRLCGPFTARRIQQIVQKYRRHAGITQPVHPHLFRHQMLTYLTAKGLSDAQIQLISGHESKKSLEVYQHLSLQSVEQDYQEAVRSVGI
jgi:integrase/recombinase XerD